MTRHLMFYLIFLLFLIVVFPNKVAHGEADNSSKIDMAVSPQNSLYNVDNMKPGDWAPRTIAIKNNGELLFEYEMNIESNGEEKLFNELLLEISIESNELYKGKLADFTGLKSRGLTPSDEDIFEVTIYFPKHLGNEFQSLDADFLFVFTAEAGSQEQAEVFVSGMIGSDGLKLPTTSTAIFTFLLVGGLLLAIGWSVKIYMKVRKGENLA